MENKLIDRRSGVLMHITSLPCEYGLGRFSSECEKFIDFLASGGFKCWQVLPIFDCGYGMSPYNAHSSFAINPYFLDIQEFLSQEEIDDLGFTKDNPNRTEEQHKHDLAIDMIYEKCKGKYNTANFIKHNNYWLENYALYKIIKKQHNNCSWVDFPVSLKTRQKQALDKFKIKYKEEIEKITLVQYLLHTRWQNIRKYAHDRNIQIFGDEPMYVQLDCDEVWANPKNWKLDGDKPTLVAGVPPDYFNREGQFWGNPIYDYDYIAKNKNVFWINRFKRISELFDIIRIDHFIAWVRYWGIPASSTSAKDGKYFKGKGMIVLPVILKNCNVKIVAEDLGIITPEVGALREKFDIPGLKVLQFAFDIEGDNMYQPHNYEKNCVAYIGTHDNETFMGMLNHSDWDKINRFKRYMGIPLEWGNDAVIDNSILNLYRSSANLIILTAQDLLKLDNSARMNTPGTMEGNWLWQMTQSMPMEIAERYKYLSNIYCR